MRGRGAVERRSAQQCRPLQARRGHDVISWVARGERSGINHPVPRVAPQVVAITLLTPSHGEIGPMRTSLWLCVLVPTALAAQQPGRKIEGELSGNLFFGNTQQVLASTRAEFERADSGSAFRTIGRFNYGETTTDLTGTIVSKRSWNAGSNYDYRPFADFTPFVRAAVESSFENKIDRR